ncbi:hypothetical protein HDU96_000514 [Phlyctochytrium bullatum]|nr:hypothetical protein HDU96_000514 [Phlyctochytrium bullatum]
MSTFTPNSLVLATLVLLGRIVPALAQEPSTPEPVLPAGVTNQIFSTLSGQPPCAASCLPAPSAEAAVPLFCAATSGNTDSIFSCLNTQCAALGTNDAAFLTQGLQVVAGGCTAILQANPALSRASVTVSAAVTTSQAETATATGTAASVTTASAATESGSTATSAATATESGSTASAGTTSADATSSASSIPAVTLTSGTSGVPLLTTTTAARRGTTVAPTTSAIPTLSVATASTKPASSAGSARAWTGSVVAAVAIAMLAA